MHSFRLGRLFGIDLRIDYSWLFIAVLLTWNLTSVFAGLHPDWPVVESIAVALLASLLFFGCIVAHELAHSLVAGRYGLRVRSITLFLFGGVSNIEHEPPSARAEFFMAIAGPISSILLGFAFLFLAQASLIIAPVVSGDLDVSRVLAGLGPITTLLAWLGPINLVIGIFNLVPAFPLDGGRVLRSILWGASGNLNKSTRQVSALGQVFGWFFIVTGIAMAFGVHILFFGTGLVGGLWLAFIGWFLHSAAVQSYTRLAVDEALGGMTVAQLMQRDGPAVGPELSLDSLVHHHLIQGDQRALPVVRDGILLGLVSIADIRSVPPDAWAATEVGSIMRRADELHLASPDEPLAKAFEQLARQDVEEMPVVVDATLVGMLRRRDVTRWLELAWRPAAGMHHPGQPRHA